MAVTDAMGVIKKLLSNLRKYWDFPPSLFLLLLPSLIPLWSESILCIIYEGVYYGPECALSVLRELEKNVHSTVDR